MSRKRRQRRHSDASRYFGLTAVIRDNSGIGPVAVKNRAAFGEERQGFRLLISKQAPARNLSDDLIPHEPDRIERRLFIDCAFHSRLVAKAAATTDYEL